VSTVGHEQTEKEAFATSVEVHEIGRSSIHHQHHHHQIPEPRFPHDERTLASFKSYTTGNERLVPALHQPHLTVFWGSGISTAVEFFIVGPTSNHTSFLLDIWSTRGGGGREREREIGTWDIDRGESNNFEDVSFFPPSLLERIIHSADGQIFSISVFGSFLLVVWWPLQCRHRESTSHPTNSHSVGEKRVIQTGWTDENDSPSAHIDDCDI